MSDLSGRRKRVREKVNTNGFDGMQPHEILEFLLFYSNSRKDTKDLGRKLIQEFKTFNAVCDASIKELMNVDGIGEQSAHLIKSIPLFARVYFDSSNKNIQISNAEDAGDFLLPKFIGRRKETVIILLLDNSNKVISTHILFEGSVNSTTINIREIVELCIKYNAPSVILSHNHPNGLAIPSSADIATTTKIRDFLSVINIRLWDHIVVADKDFVSMVESEYI